jgi:hypothetical protein
MNVQALATYIQDSREITSWASALPGVYLLRSFNDAATLSERLVGVLNEAKCVVAKIEIDEKAIGGWLPKAAWQWAFRVSAQRGVLPLPRK